MGAILKVKTLTTPAEAIIVAVLLAVILGGIYWFAPGLRVTKAKQLSGLAISKDKIDNVVKGAMLPLPSVSSSTSVANKPLNRIVEYAWNPNGGMISANGGAITTKGSLMESSGVNLEIVRRDGVSDIRDMMVKFVEEYAKGTEYPTSDASAFGASIMGDGVPYFIATLQQKLDDTFGKGKYHVQVIGAYGLSAGEDKVIGPLAWKTNPQLLRGALLSSVVGDGDWVVAVNFAFANGIPVNTDVTTYDKGALNFTPSEKDDYMNSARELVKSQLTGYTIPLKEVIDGKLTGKTINKSIDGCTTWTPGDQLAFDALTGFVDVISTKDFTNQMACTLVVVKEWALQHDKIVTSILKNTFIAGNQFKQYDQWKVFASQATSKTYDLFTPKYWYDMFKGQHVSKGGVEYNVGGSAIFNYADALQYYGITDGVNRYKAVYDQVGKYLTELNPCGFNDQVKGGVVPYDDAVNLYFLKSINDIDAGTVAKTDYSVNKTTVMAKGEWQINFATGSTAITSTKELETIYSLLVQAEKTKVNIYGHTDNVGNPNSNLVLSRGRANSVKSYLVNKGIPESRFQNVDGFGDQQPIAPNTTKAGQAKNRRCEISLLK
jgi:outer membrane protein OmpA-like peptidoglycan-associated protein